MSGPNPSPTNSWRSRLKALDLYRDIPTDLTEQTSTGALISVVAALFIAYLFISEFSSFLSPAIEHSMFVERPMPGAPVLYGDTNNQEVVDDYERLLINLNVSLPGLPCAVASLDIQDVMGSHQEDVGGKMHKIRIDRQTLQSLRGPYGDELSGEVHVTDPRDQENEGCRFQGSVIVKKVAGNLHISGHSHAQAASILFPNGQMNLSHIWHDLHFGNEEHLSSILSASVAPLKGTSKLAVDPNAQARAAGAAGLPPFSFPSYEYYLKVVPTTYETLHGEIHRSFQYVAHSNAVVGRYQPSAIFLRYDIDALTVKFTRKRKSFAHFLVQICAIIGGVFTVLGLLNMGVLQAQKQFKSNIGKLG